MNSINKKGLEKMNDDFYVFSFGGGVQSTAMLLLMREGEIKKPDLAVFADPGNEPKKVIDHIENVCVPIFKEIGVKFVTAKYGDFFPSESLGDHFFDHKNHVNKTLTRSASIPFYTKSKDGKIQEMLPRHCTGDAKINVVNKIIKRELGIDSFSQTTKKIKLMIGISLDEIQRMSINKIKKIQNYYPLIMDDASDIKKAYWAKKQYTRHECIELCNRHGITPPRSACVFCPYNNHKAWANMKKNDPDSFEQAIKWDEKIRSIKEFPEMILFVHPKRIPLKDIDFNESQLNMFDEIDHGFNAECEGMCGI